MRFRHQRWQIYTRRVCSLKVSPESAERPALSMFRDDRNVIFGVCAGGHSLHQLGKVGQAADLLQAVVALELVAQQYEVDCALPVGQADDGAEDVLMRQPVEGGRR